MKSKDKLIVALSWLCCLAAVLCALSVIAVIVLPAVSLRLRYFFLLITGSFVFPTAAALLRSVTEVNEHVKKHLVRGAVLFMFVFYIVVFLSALLLAKVVGNRTGFVFQYNKYWLEDALPNLIPFSSLTRAIKGFALGKVHHMSLFVNVFGNLFLYSPFAFFVPAVSPSMRKLDSFLPFMVFLVVFVELAQGMFGIGSFETDDIILGIGGALIAYSVFNNGYLKGFFKNNYFYF
ncbi:MAG: VanZ family protein [Ruminococcaceae bacterium]|nr:VanZ family protein [Oscillospiraceae bacterium]